LQRLRLSFAEASVLAWVRDGSSRERWLPLTKAGTEAFGKKEEAGREGKGEFRAEAKERKERQRQKRKKKGKEEKKE